MVLRCLGGSTIYDDDFCASEYGSMMRFLRSHGLFYYSAGEYEYEYEYEYGFEYEDEADYEPVYTQQQEPVFVADPNGTFYLVDCQSPQVLMSFETGNPTYAAHHSEDSRYYLIYGTNNKFRFIKTESSFFDNDRVEVVPCDVEEFIRETPEKYLDGGRLASKINTTEYLVDCQTGKIIYTFCADEVQSYQQKPAPVEHEHDQLISVKRIDYELAFYSSTTGKCLWYLRFARFDAWYETACNWTSRMREHMPYVKPYIKVFQARYHTSLTQIFRANGINISSETRRLLKKDEEDAQATQCTAKKKNKKKARKTKKASMTANTDDKGLVLGIDENDTVIKPSKRKRKKGKKGSTTVNADKKMRNESNDEDDVHINENQTPKLLVSKEEIGKGSSKSNVPEVNGDKDVETDVQDHYYHVKDPKANLVSKAYVCTLHELISLVNTPVQVQQTKKVRMITELLMSIDWWKLTWDIAEELANLHRNGIAHGDLNPHNVCIDKNAKAIIIKDPTADMSSSTADLAMDWYNMGRIFLFIATKGTCKFCDCTDVFLIADNEPEAHDITSTLLFPGPNLRLTGALVLSHRLFWNPDRCMSYLARATGYLNTEVKESYDLPQALDNVGNKVFAATGAGWSYKKYNIYPKFIQAMNDYRTAKNQALYNYLSLCELLRFIRNSYIHYQELPVEVRQELGWSNHGKIEMYWRSRFPKLLDEVYKVFDARYPWKGTLLEEYHSPG